MIRTPMETILNSRGSIRAMKTFFQKHQRLHIWLLTDLSLLAVFCLVRENRTWMNALAKHVAGPLRQTVGRLCYRTEISVMEVLAVLLVLLCAGYVVGSGIAVVRAAGHRGDRAYSAVLGAACAALTLYAGTCLL